MPIIATPESGIPLPFDTSPEELTDFRDKAFALFETVLAIQDEDSELPEVTEADKRESHRIMAAKSFPPANTLTPGTLVNLEAILTEWDHEVLDVHRRLRNFVTNKLIMESNDEDPKVRLKALELLGKTTGVNAFSDRVDINISHRTVADIEVELRKTLEMYTDYALVDKKEEFSPLAIADLDVDEELGTKEPSEASDGS